MIFHPLRLSGAFVLELERFEDERGFFARTFCAREFEAHGMNPRVAQCNVSFNLRRGTLRGMHMQIAPHEEAKLVTCVAGAIHDVVVDVRPGSPTRLQWESVELLGDSWTALYVPEGFAHGFQALEDRTVVTYQMSTFFEPDSARGLRWDNPMLGIRWPLSSPILSKKDREYPLLMAGEAP